MYSWLRKNWQMTNNWYEDYRIKLHNQTKDIDDERLEDDHTFDNFELRANSNRLMAFWGNLCGVLATFFISQAEKHGDYYEEEASGLIGLTD